jgi:hypothetical protein
VDQPSPADEASNADVEGYFLTPCVCSSIERSLQAAAQHNMYGHGFELEIETMEIQRFRIYTHVPIA